MLTGTLGLNTLSSYKHFLEGTWGTCQDKKEG